MKVTQEQARAFLIARQGFRSERSIWEGQAGVSAALRHLGAIQIDPINVFTRNHHQVLFNRVVGYRPEMLDAVLYRERSAFEYFCNALCVLPIEEYPYFAYKMRRHREDYAPSEEIVPTIRGVLEQLASNGPTASRQFAGTHKVNGWWDGQVPRTKAERLALDSLHYTGQVMITNRDGLSRLYDLPERVVPEHLFRQEVTEYEYHRFMLEKFLWSYGLSQTKLFRFGWNVAPKPELKRMLGELQREGRVVEVEISGVKSRYYCPSVLVSELMEARPMADDRAVFVAPLDNFLWDRDRTEDLFGFVYRWEVYVPEGKRQYGYYALPILWRDQFVGRIELRADRAEGVLVVNSLWMEKNMATAREAVANTVAETAARLGLREKFD